MTKGLPGNYAPLLAREFYLAYRDPARVQPLAALIARTQKRSVVQQAAAETRVLRP